MNQAECVQCGQRFTPASQDAEGIISSSTPCTLGGNCFTVAGLTPAAPTPAPAPPPKTPTLTRQWTGSADKMRRVMIAKRHARQLARRARAVLAAAMAGKTLDEFAAAGAVMPPPASLDIQLKGRVKERVSIPETSTVGDLVAIVRSLIGDARPIKLSLRGKNLKDHSKTVVEVGMKDNSKVMVLAAKKYKAPAKEEKYVPCKGAGCTFFALPSNQSLCSRCLDIKKAREAAEERKEPAISTIAVQTPGGSVKSVAIKKMMADRRALNRRDRCGLESCKKKLRHMGIQCRCEIVFCTEHRYAEEHNCPFDHQDFARANLSSKMTKVQGDRMRNRL